MSALRNSLLVGALGIGLFSQSAGAQTFFLRPDTTPDYASYRYADECSSALKRIEKSINDKSSVFQDTVSFALRTFPSIPPEILASRPLCKVDVNIDTIPLSLTHGWVEDLLWLGRENDAERLYLRLFDSIDASQHYRELEKMSINFLRLRPYFFDVEKRFYRLITNKLPSDSVIHRFLLHMKLIEIAAVQKQFDSVELLIKEGLALVDKIPEDLKHSYRYRGPVGGLLQAMMYIPQEGWDSLSTSTDAYRKYQQALISKIFPRENLPNVVGLKPPPLKGNYWYQRDAMVQGDGKMSPSYRKISPQIRPVPGKINAIVFLQGGCHTSTPRANFGRKNSPMNCLPQIAALRRAKQAFPELEITIVTNTYGNLGDAPPLSPADEADTLANYFLDFHRIPAVHVIAETPYFRLPGLDRRIIDGENMNDEAYTLEGTSLAIPGSVLLIDESGSIVFRGSIAGIMEEVFQMSIAVVTRRMQSRSR